MGFGLFIVLFEKLIMAEIIACIVGLALIGGPKISRAFRAAQLKRQSGTTFDSSRARQYMGPFETSMTLREATLILGVRESVGKEKILAAHKRLMLLNHPDNGGSTYIASKVNQAKEMIMSRLS